MGKAIFGLRKVSSLLVVGVIVWTSLTGCSRKLTETQAGSGDVGFAKCDGSGTTNIGSFDVYLVRTADLSKFELYVIPVELAVPGVLGNIDISNKSPSTLALVPQVNFVAQQEILAGYLTETDLQNYDILSINEDDGSGRAIQDQTPERFADCQIPLPGEGTQFSGVTTAFGVTRIKGTHGSRKSLPLSQARSKLIRRRSN